MFFLRFFGVWRFFGFLFVCFFVLFVLFCGFCFSFLRLMPVQVLPHGLFALKSSFILL